MRSFDRHRSYHTHDKDTYKSYALLTRWRWLGSLLS